MVLLVAKVKTLGGVSEAESRAGSAAIHTPSASCLVACAESL